MGLRDNGTMVQRNNRTTGQHDIKGVAGLVARATLLCFSRLRDNRITGQQIYRTTELWDNTTRELWDNGTTGVVL